MDQGHSTEFSDPSTPRDASRRSVMWGGLFTALAVAYGTLTAFAFRFIFPSHLSGPARRIFIGFAAEIGVGESKLLALPSGDQLLVSNTGRIRLEAGSSYVGFSNRCPHLGCRVHYDSSQRLYICPCHQGIFDSDGVAISGPPAQAGQRLKSYRIALEGKSMYAVVEDV